MSTIITIQATDIVRDSRADINTNFSNLNADKLEASALIPYYTETEVDTLLAAKANNTGATLTSASVNGVTLSTTAGTSVFLRGDGTYATPSGSGGLSLGVSFAVNNNFYI